MGPEYLKMMEGLDDVIAVAAALYRIVDRKPTDWSRAIGYAADGRFSVASAGAQTPSNSPVS
jgi:hypothetical protein